MALWVYECKNKHTCTECNGTGVYCPDDFVGDSKEEHDGHTCSACPSCDGIGEYGDAKIERLDRGKRRRPNPLCHLCGKKMKWVKYPGSNFELKGKGWSK